MNKQLQKEEVLPEIVGMVRHDSKLKRIIKELAEAADDPAATIGLRLELQRTLFFDAGITAQPISLTPETISTLASRC